MEFRDDAGPVPDPPTIDDVARSFPVPLVALVPQPSVRESGVSTTSTVWGSRPVELGTAALSYAVLWNPEQLDHPGDATELDRELEEMLAQPPALLQPDAVERLSWAPFASVPEAVQTALPAPGAGAGSLPQRLALHMRHVLSSSFRAERDPTPHEPGIFAAAPDARDAREASVVVDGVERPALTIDDEHVLGLGVDLGDAMAIVVWPRHLLPLVRLELTRRPRG
ncbi:hypothetical protein [Agrococcus sp. HG114]|uniref:hypothetical protein n=1 Tax=Agrococcus sp. HG114 TaxID=2969757 RepID=UPI00215B3ECE|nr:hypothetical protein [Agrococcus sp. HG114]MCR8671383.1 hypothetical protein [Agrococcus sp. HG114]